MEQTAFERTFHWFDVLHCFHVRVGYVQCYTPLSTYSANVQQNPMAQQQYLPRTEFGFPILGNPGDFPWFARRSIINMLKFAIVHMNRSSAPDYQLFWCFVMKDADTRTFPIVIQTA
jgi:hypothetical protein